MEKSLPLPFRRCLTKEEAAEYLGIGVTLLAELGVPAVKLGRRCVYDVIDLDAWLEEHKRRGRAGKEVEEKWLAKPESTGDRIPGTGGLTLRYRTADAYAKALGLRTGKKQLP
ncbi:MAG TPA: helix-turn-helix domain-containing protein [Burkholderiales bacterium]|nr:helix-turn-helix domain-containing protein [Burkholderiales bacterium]